jgi:hypothetical protein
MKLLAVFVCAAVMMVAQDASKAPMVRASWLDTDQSKKAVVRLDSLPDDFMFEFWFGAAAPHITKAQLAEALEMYQARRIQSDKTCILTAQGGILNYPCKVRSTQPHPLAAIAKK